MQGLSSWVEISNMGKNLYQLLMADHRLSARSNGTAKKTEDTKDTTLSDGAQQTTNSNNVPVLFGQYSHGTAHSFFGTYEASALIRNWRAQTPQRVIDKVKHFLINDMTGAEWEVLEEMEWSHADEENNETPVLVKPRRTSTAATASGHISDGKNHATGKSGWTKLRSRSDGNGETKSGNATGNEEI
jgi:hypothetical protein